MTNDKCALFFLGVMGKLNQFSISFPNSGVFYAGTMLQGHVTVELNAPMSMRGIKLNFEGKGFTSWTLETDNKTTVTTLGADGKTLEKKYNDTEQYFNEDVLLFGIMAGQGSQNTELPAGTHTFPFQFQLPLSLPSSFEAEYGHVRYTVKCNIDKPWKSDYETKQSFTVISILDLNQQPNSQESLKGSNQKTLCWLCCASGPITASLHIDRQGYVPGEAIKLYAEISNGASRSISKSYVVLKMKTIFPGSKMHQVATTEVACVTHPGFEGHSQDQWTGELVIPSLPPSYLFGCSLMDIRYILQLTVVPSGPASPLEVPLEILIGTIPLRQVVEQRNGGASSMPESISESPTSTFCSSKSG